MDHSMTTDDQPVEGEAPPEAPPVRVTIAPTARAKCKKTGNPIDKGAFRLTVSYVKSNHIEATHTALVNVTQRVLSKYDATELVSDLDDADREVAERIIDAILRKDIISEEDAAYRHEFNKKPPPKRKLDAMADLPPCVD